MFKFEVDVSDIIQLLVFLGTIASMYARLKSEMAELKTKVDALWQKFVHNHVEHS